MRRKLPPRTSATPSQYATPPEHADLAQPACRWAAKCYEQQRVGLCCISSIPSYDHFHWDTSTTPSAHQTLAGGSSRHCWTHGSTRWRWRVAARFHQPSSKQPPLRQYSVTLVPAVCGPDRTRRSPNHSRWSSTQRNNVATVGLLLRDRNAAFTAACSHPSGSRKGYPSVSREPLLCLGHALRREVPIQTERCSIEAALPGPTLLDCFACAPSERLCRTSTGRAHRLRHRHVIAQSGSGRHAVTRAARAPMETGLH